MQRVSIQSDPRLNAIIVTDVPERMALYERLITQLDVPSPLIEIEAMIIDVNSDRVRDLGVNWSLRAGGVSADFGTLGALSVTVNSAGGAASSSSGFLAQIRLLESTGDARIQSRPSVLTTDNIGALLDLSETFYVRVQGERVASVSPVTASTTLRVTPRLVNAGEATIQLTVDIEDGQIQSQMVDSLPTVRRSSVSTQAVVRHGEALVIAGYSSDQAVNARSKIPLLGDLPGVGALFAMETRRLQKRERIFLIRPRLVSDASGAGAPAPVELTR
jgi:type III secretion protein C